MQHGAVTVVVPTRNRLTLLQRTLESVLRQAVELEVIVVDEASSDGTYEWLEAHGDPRVHVVRNDRPMGVSRARNAGIDRATGEWLAFVDDDDRWAPDKLEAQLAAIADTPGSEWCACGAVSVDTDDRVLRTDDAPRAGDVASLLLTSNRIPGGASGVLARASTVRTLGGFDPALAMCADWDLWIRLALASPMAAVHRPLVAYLVHGESMSTDLGALDHETKLVVDKHRLESSSRGVTLEDVGGDPWSARAHERAGRRLAAARVYLAWAWRSRAPRKLADAARALVAPRWAARRRARAKERAMSAAWRDDLSRWLWRAP